MDNIIWIPYKDYLIWKSLEEEAQKQFEVEVLWGKYNKRFNQENIENDVSRSTGPLDRDKT